MKTTPREFQRDVYDLSKDRDIFALWWEMGLGKSKLVIDTACHLYEEGKIEGLLVLAPNGVHGNFLSQEWPIHAWDEIKSEGLTYYTSLGHTKKGQRACELFLDAGSHLLVLVMHFDGVKTKHGYDLASRFLRGRKCMIVADESTAISEPGTERSKKCVDLAELAPYRRVLSGTPIAEGPFKIFNQMRFLNKNFWKKYGMASYFGFKTQFGVFRTGYGTSHQYTQLVEYQNLGRLTAIVKDYSSRLLKDDVLDLPPKIYMRVEFDLTDKQRKIYNDLLSTFRSEIDYDNTIEIISALVRVTRLQQLTSGYAVTQSQDPIAVGDQIIWNVESGSIVGEVLEVNEHDFKIIGRSVTGEMGSTNSEQTEYVVAKNATGLVRLSEYHANVVDVEEPKNNPRLRALEQILEPITTKVIIWARFKRDIDLICDLLGDKAVRYDGSVPVSKRAEVLRRFREDPSVQYFVANPAAISMGVTLVIAKTVIYYSNSFQLIHRLQSEDRAHRIGQDSSLTIVDMIAKDTVDQHIVTSLRKKFDISAAVSGDRLREWIR